jgi:hypothetical protein
MQATGSRLESSSTETDLSRHLSAALRPLSLLGGLTAAGVFVVYLMGLVGILPGLGWQLPAGALLLGLFAWVHVPIVSLASNGKGTRAY